MDRRLLQLGHFCFMAHTGMLAGAGVALVASIVFGHAVRGARPSAAGRINHDGFSTNNSQLIDSYSLTLMGVGLGQFAIASASRYYFRPTGSQSAVVADIRAKTFRAPCSSWPHLFDKDQLRAVR